MSYKDYNLPAVVEPAPDADADKDAATPEAHGSDGSDSSDSSDSDDDDYQRRYQHDDNGSGVRWQLRHRFGPCLGDDCALCHPMYAG